MQARDGDWLSQREAARVLGISPRKVKDLAAEKLLTARSVPGSLTRYSRASVEALRDKHTTAAAS